MLIQMRPNPVPAGAPARASRSVPSSTSPPTRPCRLSFRGGRDIGQLQVCQAQFLLPHLKHQLGCAAGQAGCGMRDVGDGIHALAECFAQRLQHFQVRAVDFYFQRGRERAAPGLFRAR